MSVFAGSRYALGENKQRISATRVIVGDIAFAFLHDRRTLKLKDMRRPVNLHEAQGTELLDLLAFDACADSQKWWVIADINEFFYPDDEIETGMLINIPSLEDLQAN